jgi:hypothetical protein
VGLAKSVAVLQSADLAVPQVQGENVMPRKRKGKKHGKKRHGKRGGHVPLPILKRRLTKLAKIVAARS